MSNDKKVINHLISIIILSTLIILFSLGELGLIIITLSLMYFIIYSIITYQTTMSNNNDEELDVHSYVPLICKTRTIKIKIMNNEIKQTAVEWLEFEINKRGPKENNPPQWLIELYKQAKEMEKERMIEFAQLYAVIHCMGDITKNAEQFYKETYENEQ